MERISPNQNHNCIAVSTAAGYNIFSLKDLTLLSRQERPNPLPIVRHVEMYYLTNIVLLVYDKTPNEIVVWDDYNQKENDRLTFDCLIHKIILREKRLYVHTTNESVEIFDVRTFTRLAEIQGVPHFPGMCLEVPSAIDDVIGWNLKEHGAIKLVSLVKLPKLAEEVEVVLHKNNTCRNFAFNRRGTHLASNSKGTIIKLYDIAAKTKRSFHINMFGKDITCLFFVPGHTYLAVVEEGGGVKVLDTSGDVSEAVSTATSIMDKLSRKKAFMTFNVPFKRSKVCFNEAIKCLFFYTAEREVAQIEVSFKEKVVSQVRMGRLEVPKGADER